MSAEPERRLCGWVTCDDVDAVPGSLFCAPHGRQARAEGTPWRHPESAPPRDPGNLRAVPGETTRETIERGSRIQAEFTAPPPASPPARPLQPAQATCRREGCTDPPLEKTLASRSNRWRNLCERHYQEARRNALGPERRAQLLEVAGPPPMVEPEEPEATRDPAPTIEPTAFPPIELDAARHPEAITGEVPPSYGDRAAVLFELAAQVDDAQAELAAAIARWRAALAELA